MLLSEFIAILQAELQQHGDAPVSAIAPYGQSYELPRVSFDETEKLFKVSGDD